MDLASTGCITYNKMHDFCLRLEIIVMCHASNTLIKSSCCVDTATSNVSNISSLVESTDPVPVIESGLMTFIKSITSFYNISVTSSAEVFMTASTVAPNDSITTCATVTPTTVRIKENKGIISTYK